MTEEKSAPGLCIHLLGEFWTEADGRRIADGEWQLRKGKELLALLALAPGHRLPKARAAELLWPEREEERSFNSLNRTLWWLRRLLQPDRLPGEEWRYLQLHQGILLLASAGRAVVDADLFEAAAAHALRVREPDAFARALDLYSGDLLAEAAYEDWAQGPREALMARHAALLLEAADFYAAEGDRSRAILALRRLVATQPMREEAQARLIRLYAATDNRYAALRQYQVLRDVLWHELGTEPDAALQQLYRTLAVGNIPTSRELSPDAGRAAAEVLAPGATTTEQPAPGGGPKLTSRLAPSSSFVGRRQELDEMQRRLGSARLITLTGPGGSGKTRLALAAAVEAAADFPDGVWTVGLAAIRGGRLVADAVAMALGLSTESGHEPAETLVTEIGDQRALLVLDNCEHVIDACAALVTTLLRGCPRVRILATSRRRLAVRGEVVYPVPLFAVPDVEHLPPFELLERYDAIRLFAVRAREAHAGFALTPQNAATVVALCQRLAGLPLAIELAAIRCRMLSVEEIAQRLDDCFAVLAPNPHSDARQRTLETTLAWSYGLLAPAERRFLGRLSVFVGGWTLEAAEGICADERIERRDVLGVLGQLVEHSLVLAEPDAAGTRFHLLEPIRQFAARRLKAAGEESALRRSHARWFLALAEALEPRLTGPEQRRWMERLDEERDNLRAALSWALGAQAVELGLRLAAALDLYWLVRGMPVEARDWYDRLLSLARDIPDVPAPLLVSALYGSGRRAAQLGDVAVAVERAEEVLALCARLGNPVRETVGALAMLADVAQLRGDRARVRALLEASLEVARAGHDAHREAVTLSNLADEARGEGDLERAATLYSECLAIGQATGDDSLRSMALINLGKVALSRGDLAAAGPLFDDGLALARQLGVLRGIADTQVARGELALRQHETERARDCFREAFELYRTSRLAWLAAEALEHLAALFADLGHPDTATLLLAATCAVHHAARLPDPEGREEYRKLATALRDRLDPQRFAEAWTRGLGMAPLEAVEATLEALGRDSMRSGSVGRKTQRAVPQALSPRQAQIAMLVAQGRTNVEIATSLGIEKRTVDAHVGAILARLRVSSRAEVAAKLRATR